MSDEEILSPVAEGDQVPLGRTVNLSWSPDRETVEEYIVRVGGQPLNPGPHDQALSPEQYARFHADELRRLDNALADPVSPIEGLAAAVDVDPYVAFQEKEAALRLAIRDKVMRRNEFWSNHKRVDALRLWLLHDLALARRDFAAADLLAYERRNRAGSRVAFPKPKHGFLGKHRWTDWSEPHTATLNSLVFRRSVNTTIQTRQCLACKKIQTRGIDD